MGIRDSIKALRAGEFDVLVGINLLREGLDIPEVSLVTILDADKEGFLRSTGSLIQTFGRAARNAGGKVCLLYTSWGITAPSSLHWLDEPPVEAVNQAIPLLRSLEAVSYTHLDVYKRQC